MTFETLDWESLAKRIVIAFDLDESAEYKFAELSKNSPRTVMALYQNGKASMPIPAKPEIIFDCNFGQAGSFFGLTTNGTVDGRHQHIWTTIAFDLAGNLKLAPSEMGNGQGQILAKGLFYLGMLTPEAENALQVSSHQKLEWTLEHPEPRE